MRNKESVLVNSRRKWWCMLC